MCIHLHTVPLIKKLAIYNRCTGTGTGVLRATVRACYIRALRRPYCLTNVEANDGIRSARQFRMSVGSEIDADHTVKRKL